MIRSARANGTLEGEERLGAMFLSIKEGSLWKKILEALGEEEEIMRSYLQICR